MSRQLLRVFGSRGNQTIPFVPGSPGQQQATSENLLNYFTPFIIVASIGVGIGVLTLLVALILCCTRCCCNCPCKGEPDPEFDWKIVRVCIVGLCILVLVGAFIGLFGGKTVSESVRTSMDRVQSVLTTFFDALVALADVATRVGVNSQTLTDLQTQVGAMKNTVGTASIYVTPVDTARLGLLYGAMSVGMLAAVGFGIGALLKRKEILIVSLTSAVIAIVMAWVSFAINYPMAVLVDDGCVTIQDILQSGTFNVNGFNFLVQCLPRSLFTDADNAVFNRAISVGQSLVNDESNINSNTGISYFNPITVSMAAINATNGNMTLLAPILASQLNATLNVIQTPPCSTAAACAQDSNLLSDVSLFNVTSIAATALSQLQNCSQVQSLLSTLNDTICQQLVVGILLTFVGNIIVGSLLIPAGIMSIFVAQKFPNRSSAAMLKSRIMVIFVIQFFQSLVAVLSECNKYWAELLIAILSVVGGLLGFLFLQIPMNKLDWDKPAQIFLSLCLMIVELGLCAGWAWLFANAIINNMACTQQLLAQVNLPSFSFNIFAGSCNQSSYSHTMVLSILAGVCMGLCFTGALLAACLAGSIACGTRLNLQDSDYELD